MLKLSFTLVNGVSEDWTLYNLNTLYALQYEGLRQHHCVGDKSFFSQKYTYWEMIQKQEALIWSLRRSKDEPLLTMTVCKPVLTGQNGRLRDISGLVNREPNALEAAILLKALEALRITTHQLVFNVQSDVGLETVKCEQVGKLPEWVEKNDLDSSHNEE